MFLVCEPSIFHKVYVMLYCFKEKGHTQEEEEKKIIQWCPLYHSVIVFNGNHLTLKKFNLLWCAVLLYFCQKKKSLFVDLFFAVCLSQMLAFLLWVADKYKGSIIFLKQTL